MFKMYQAKPKSDLNNNPYKTLNFYPGYDWENSSITD